MTFEQESIDTDVMDFSDVLAGIAAMEDLAGEISILDAALDTVLTYDDLSGDFSDGTAWIELD